MPRGKTLDKSLKFHKPAYHLFSMFISKRGFSVIQTRTTFGEVLSGNHRFLRPSIRLVTLYNCTYLARFTILCNKSIVFRIPRLFMTNNRLALPLPTGSDYARDHQSFYNKLINSEQKYLMHSRKYEQTISAQETV